ncbi:uncharacterized protein LOC113210524 isoform X2 [Frankliniella occidentalis]|uniref:Uncharacterized protein LOC113210524 isoform X2 n=1 Tax=Frankliniella occidentalis TaxID=133901 RepID=A0A6J1T0Y1_FRAOC|nr:uncharacterized protein LOC113210524 isoform X2 [Frankliniella occidentalis]
MEMGWGQVHSLAAPEFPGLAAGGGPEPRVGSGLAVSGLHQREQDVRAGGTVSIYVEGNLGITMRGSALLAIVALCTISAANARPDCNACFMKNAGRDKESNATVGDRQQRSQLGEQNKSDVSERVLRSKRTAAWGAQQEVQQSVQTRLRDVLLAQNAERLRERLEADAADQWWEDSPANVDGAPEGRQEGGEWGDIKQVIPSYSQQAGFGRMSHT